MHSNNWSDKVAMAAGGNPSHPIPVSGLKELEAFLRFSTVMGGNMGISMSVSRHGAVGVSPSLVQIFLHSLRSWSIIAWGDAVRFVPSPTVALSPTFVPSRFTRRWAVAAPDLIWSATKVFQLSARDLKCSVLMRSAVTFASSQERSNVYVSRPGTWLRIVSTCSAQWVLIFRITAASPDCAVSLPIRAFHWPTVPGVMRCPR